MLRRTLIHGNQSPIILGSVKKDVMLLKITSPTARNDASARLCEVWNKPKQSLVGSRSSSLHHLLGLSQNLKISNHQPFLSSQKLPSFARRGGGDLKNNILKQIGFA
jgi:hypothetical protein